MKKTYKCFTCGGTLTVVGCYRRGDFWYETAEATRQIEKGELDKIWIECKKCHSSIDIIIGHELWTLDGGSKFAIINLRFGEPINIGDCFFVWSIFKKRIYHQQPVIIEGVHDYGKTFPDCDCYFPNLDKRLCLNRSELRYLKYGDLDAIDE